MESNRHSYDDHAEEEDYIDMDVNVNSETTIFIHTKITSPQFEFQMSTTTSSENDFSLPSPADELFYKGKLLPLHLPPRLQMVEKLLQNTSTFDYKLSNTLNDDSFTTTSTTPLFTATNNSPANNNTPFQSCTISPNDSVQVSRELNPEEYFTEYSSHTCKLVVGKSQKKSWAKKLSFGSKLKASRSYLKSFFRTKSACSKENSVSASRTNFNEEKEAILKTKQASNMFVKMPKKNPPFGHIQRIPKQENLRASHRRSFSGVIKRISIPRSSSSIFVSAGSSSSSFSSSTNSNGFVEKERHMLKRSNSVGSDMENPIQAAIAHCKKSQERLNHSRKALSELGFCNLSTATYVKFEDQRPTVCRGPL